MCICIHLRLVSARVATLNSVRYFSAYTTATEKTMHYLRFLLSVLGLVLFAPSYAITDCDKQLQQAHSLPPAEAIAHYQKLLKQCPKKQLAIVPTLVEVYQRQGQHDAAIKLYQDSLQALESKKPDKETQAALLSGLGKAYQVSGAYAKAEPALQQALALREKQHGQDHIYVAYSLNELASLYDDQGQYDKAEPLYVRALAIKEAHLGENDPNLTTSLNNLALLYTHIGEYAKARPLYQRALVLRERQYGQDHPKVARSLNNLALLYYKLADYPKADTLYQRALKIRETELGSDHIDVANTLHNLALLYQVQEKLDQARPLYERALTIYQAKLGDNHPTVATLRNNLAALLRKQGDASSAATQHQQALAIRTQTLGDDHPAVASSLDNLATLHKQKGELAAAEQAYLRALLIAMRHQKPDLLWYIQNNLGDLLRMQQQPMMAIFFYKQAVNTLQGLRDTVDKLDKLVQKAFLNNKQFIYQQLTDLLLEQGRLLEAQEVLAMLKEENYFDFVERDSEADIRRTRATLSVEEQQWANHLAKVVKIKDLNQASQQLHADFTALKQREQTDTTFSDEQQTAMMNVPQLLHDIEADAVIVQYLMTTDRLHIVVTSSKQQLSRSVAVDKQTLNRQILHFHAALQDPTQVPTEAAQALYAWLLAPISDDLVAMKAKVLMLSLDGVLHYVPFAALHDGKQYVVERYALVNYSDAARAHLTAKPQAQWAIAGLGLSQEIKGFNPLPMVETELAHIVRETPKDEDGVLDGVVYLNDAFNARSLQAVLIKPFAVLHIASHFVFKPGTEQKSYLLLGNGEPLTLAQLRKQFAFPNVDLLTLSACETALGKLSNGREIEGFGTLAQHKGAKSVIATLWEVNDESTGLFMQDFYRRYQTEDKAINKAQALQQVQQAFISAADGKNKKIPYFFATPYYWAAFVLTGNWL